MATASAPRADPAIRTDGLTKRFGGTVAVDDLTLTAEPGEVFGFLAPTAPASPRQFACSA